LFILLFFHVFTIQQPLSKLSRYDPV
jgi:hypothetical protein